MTGTIRVLIVDDSSVVRRLLTNALAVAPQIEVVGTAANGVLALSKIAQLEPDAVILDIEMPEMDGIATLIKLRQTHARLPVIMFSTLTERGANVTFDALAAGASDYVLKPSVQRGESLDAVVANSLVPKLLALTRSAGGGTAAAAPLNVLEARSSMALPKQFAPASPTGARPGLASLMQNKPAPLFTEAQRPTAASLLASQRPETTASTSFANKPSGLLTAPQRAQRAAVGLLQPGVRSVPQIIAIAASTGGPNALADVLLRIPRDLPVPIVIVQHMPPIFTRCLAERLASRAKLRVVESEGGELLQPGCVYIAPGNRHLELVRDSEGVRTLLTDAPHENSCRPAADVLFRSVARAYGAAVLGVVLTGMGHDGARGAQEICAAGGRVLVQSGPTCVVWGMPKAVEEAGLADAVVPLGEMAGAILHRVALGLAPLPLAEGTP